MIQKFKDKAKEWLLWSQKYTKTDMIYLARGSFWLHIGDVSASAFSFLMAIAFANFLSQETYGVYKYITSIGGILGSLSLSGIGTSLTRSVAQGNDVSLIPAVKTSIKWASLGSLASIGVASYYFVNDNQILATAFFIVAGFLPFKGGFALYKSFLEGKKQFDTATQYSIIEQILSSIILFVTIILSDNIFIILVSYFFPRILVNLYFLIKIVKNIGAGAASRKDTTISFGKHLSVLHIFFMIGTEIDKILLWKFLGPASLAVYTFALAPVNQIRSVLGSIGPLAFPKLAQKSPEELKSALPRKIILMLGVIVVFTLAYVFVADFLFKIFFPQYSASVIYSQVFALSLLFLPRNLLSDSIVAQGDKKKLYILTPTNSIFRIIIMFVLIKFYGIWGAVIAQLIAGLFGYLLSYYLFKKL